MDNIIFHQLFEKETSTYTYILGCGKTHEAIIIDPVVEMVERDLKLIEELGLKLKYVLDTHVHADHVTGSGEIRKRTGAKVALSSAYDMSCPDLHLEDNQELKFGELTVRALHTPGHTSGCLSYVVGNMVFTGDALLIRGCGRTDFQEGSSDKLFESVRGKIFTLSDDTIIYPGHDYKGFSKSSVGEEKKYNPRLKVSNNKEVFMDIMSNLKLAHPKKINEAVPANLHCGLTQISPKLNSKFVDGVSSVTAESLHENLGLVKIIDVRGEDEFNNELGHIAHADLATLGPALDKRLNDIDQEQEIVFVCRSGKRSAEAVKLANLKGFHKVHNMEGGMLKWNELKYSIDREMGGS